MKLAIFTSHFPGRINTFFARDVRGLIDAGVDVEIFATHPLDPHLWMYVPDVLSEHVLPRSNVHHLDVLSSVGRAASWPHTWSQAPAIAGVVGSAMTYGPVPVLKTAYLIPKAMSWARDHGSRFDHVLAYWGNYPATCAYLFHRAAGRDIPFSMFLHAGTDLYRDRIYLGQKMKYADNIFVVCAFNRDFLKSTYPSDFDQLSPRIRVHHLGLDLDAIKWDRSGRRPNLVVAAGGLHPGKGFDDLLRAAGELRQRGREVETEIVGDGPERPALEALTERLGLRARVRFLGWLSPEATLDVVRRATLLVHPSIGLGDAVPTVIKEAMALGTPVIASSIAGIPELLNAGRCGVLTPPRDPVALSKAIERLLDAPEQRDQLATLARQRAEQMFDQRRNGTVLADRLRTTRRRGSITGPATDLGTSPDQYGGNRV